VAYITAKKIHGRTYRYLVHSVRHGQQVSQVFDAYIGPVLPVRVHRRKPDAQDNAATDEVPEPAENQLTTTLATDKEAKQ